MKAIVVALALLLFISISSWPAPAVSQVRYDAMLLVEQWPLSYCYGRRCSETYLPSQRFNIHGLRPMKSNGQPADSRNDGELCRGLAYDASQLPPDLGNVWTGVLFVEPNRVLWEKEWTRHGKCSNLKQLVYFERAKALFQSHNTREIIGLTPGVAHPVLITTIRNNLSGKAVLHSCKQDTKGRWMLEEIGWCVNGDATFVDCPQYIMENSNCQNAQTLYIRSASDNFLFNHSLPGPPLDNRDASM